MNSNDKPQKEVEPASISASNEKAKRPHVHNVDAYIKHCPVCSGELLLNKSGNLEFAACQKCGWEDYPRLSQE